MAPNDRLHQERNELRRLQQAADEKDKEIADLKQSLEEMKSEMKLKKGSGLKRVRKADKSDEDNRLTMSGKKYALTTRLWLPEVGLELQEDSTDPEQILLKEYIAALPPGEQEGYSKVATVRMFQDGLEAIRTQMAHRTRKEASNLIFGNETADLMRDSSRRNSEILMALNHFDPEKKRYDTSKQPVYAIGGEAEGGSRAARFLRHKVPMKVVRASLFGKSSLESDTKKISPHTLGMKLRIKAVTPGLMALGVVLASWAVSADSEFTPTGGVTRIGWEALFDKIKSLAELLVKTKAGQETLKIWNSYIFANTCDPDEGEDANEEEDEFALLGKELELESELATSDCSAQERVPENGEELNNPEDDEISTTS